jgi:hypothetical protein
MAVTGAIALGASSCKTGQQVTATCTLTNGGASDVQLVGLQPVVGNGEKGIELGQPPLGGSFGSTIAASGGTLKVSFTVVPHSPLSNYLLAEPASQTYAIGAYFQTSDGTSTAASTSTLTVGYAGN